MGASGYVAVVGGINMDIQGRSRGAFMLGDSNPGEASRCPGGVGRNIAENLVRLGMAVELVTVLGDDGFSEELEASCTGLGIGLSGALRLRDCAAPQYVCLLDPDGRLVGAIAAMEMFGRLGQDRLAERADLLDGARLILVDANIPEESIAWLAARYGRRLREGAGGPLLALDPVSGTKAARARAFVGDFDFAKPNRAEALVLLDGASSAPASFLGDSDLPSLGAALRSGGLGEAFISLGAEGLYCEGPGPGGQVLRGIARPPIPLPSGLAQVNVSGAGDAACAALIWGLLGGFSLEERSRLAVAAAVLASAATSTVNPALSPRLLGELAQGVPYEPLP